MKTNRKNTASKASCKVAWGVLVGLTMMSGLWNAPSARADIFMEIEGLQLEEGTGEEGYGEAINVDSVGMAANNAMAGIGGGGGGRGGKTTLQDLTVSLPFGKASPKLFLFCVTGKRLPRVTLTVSDNVGRRRSGFVLRYVIEDCLITSYQVNAANNEQPKNEIKIGYSKITVESGVKLDGDKANSATWDLVRNMTR